MYNEVKSARQSKNWVPSVSFKRRASGAGTSEGGVLGGDGEKRESKSGSPERAPEEPASERREFAS